MSLFCYLFVTQLMDKFVSLYWVIIKDKTTMGKTISTKAKEPIRLRTKRLSNGNLSIYLDFYRNGIREYEFLKLYLIPEKSKSDKLRNEETLRTANAIKAQRIISLQNEEYGFSMSNKAKVNFIEYLKQQVNEYQERNSIAYSESINVTIGHLIQYKGDKFTLKQVDKPFLLGFIDYLNRVKSRRGIPLSEASKSLYYDVVSIALNKAVKDEIIPVNPASKIPYTDRPQPGKATKTYLTFEEVKSLINTPCYNNEIKMAFLFSCFCGLRYSDVKGLTWGKVHKVDNGLYQVEIKQQKTGEVLYLPLSDNALQWLPEKDDVASTNKKVFNLPNSTTTIEKYLGIWAQDAGINKHVTFHVARHTNATLMLYFGADIYTVSKLLGHTNVKTTQVYAKIVDENKRKAVNLIPEIEL